MPIKIRPATPADHAVILNLENESRQSEPPLSMETFRYLERPESRPPNAVHERWVVECEEVVGTAFLESMVWQNAPGAYIVKVVIARSHRRKGVGSTLLEYVEARARELQAEKLYGWVVETEPDSLRFAQRRAFMHTGRQSRHSRLDVRAARLKGFEGVEEKLRLEDIHIMTLEEAGSDDPAVLEALYEVDRLSGQGIPGSEEFKMIPFDVWRRELRNTPGVSPEHTWVATHGRRPVGNAVLELRAPTTAFNDYTGVLPDYQRRGIARALKFRTVEWCRHHGIEYIYTENDGENARMLSINVSLGYEMLPASYELLKWVDRAPPQ